nr:MAG TPA: hypothetical protein [Bacteriophage sp.]
MGLSLLQCRPSILSPTIYQSNQLKRLPKYMP